jgi:hypothetical protein
MESAVTIEGQTMQGTRSVQKQRGGAAAENWRA